MKALLIPASVAALLLGCSTYEGAGTAGGTQAAAGAGARANLRPTKGNPTAGTVTFRQAGNRLIVNADVSGLPANKEFGFHVHEKGDCSAPDASSAGGHFNPGNKPHGHPLKADDRHAGDLPNLKSNADGLAELTYETPLLTVRAGPASVVGRAVVVHANPDDYKSQPAGESGPRLACGVIEAADAR